MTHRRPAALGFRMPPEWHPHSATWLAWPKDPLTWPGRVPEVEETFLKMIAALAPHETVNLLVDDAGVEQRVCAGLPGVRAGNNVLCHRIRTVDAWIRDYGPNFIVGNGRQVAFNDWIFNAWGDKYEELKGDNSIPARLESLLGVPRFQPGIVLEGGAIEVDGAGVCMTTEQCLLHPNRNPHLDRKEIEAYLKDFLGVEKVLWLGQGIAGDDTDGHIDDLARFVSPRSIVCALEEDRGSPNYRPLQDNFKRLRSAVNARGAPYQVIQLPMPPEICSDRGPLPASYANFYIANNTLLVPIFDHPNDARALAILQSLFPDRRAIGIDCRALVWGMGAIHCVTQQQPRAAAMPCAAESSGD
ncbi:MAG: agmatine deiminase family protein [Acidobacteria bacterium]|nr:agmatine deiminase family protein [Acidobacteriota bacterium]